ncbi:MAG: glycoside hydrolase family 99-like domain-containing protein, partial [Desulfobacterales bacterium]
YVGASPKLYGEWLLGTLCRHPIYSSEENFVFINAWNEWAEGCHLEPDERWGRGFLEAHHKAIRKYYARNRRGGETRRPRMHEGTRGE